MSFDWLPAIVAGFVGGVVMIGIRWVLRAAGVRLKMHVGEMWASMLNQSGSTAVAVGWGVHLALSSAIAVIYALGMALLGVPRELAWLWGVVGGAIHWAAARVLMSVMPVVDPAIPREKSPPGMFVSRYGRSDVIGFLVGPLAFGVTVGLLYALLHS